MTWENFNEIFMKDVTYDNIKSHKKSGTQNPLSEKCIFGKATEGKGGGGVSNRPLQFVFMVKLQA